MVGFIETGGATAVAAALSRIMLKYRPIAPKPAAGGSPAAAGQKPAGSRRKAAGRSLGRKSRRRRTVVPSSTSSYVVTTLALMPETPERKEPGPTPAPSPSPTSSCGELTSTRGRDLASWVTVESVTDTWREEEVGFGCSDETVAQGLEGDSSPCFVSDGWGRVTWTNAGYRRMVAAEEEEEGAMRVALVTRGMVLPAEGTCRAFTCRVSVRYACGRRGRVTLAAPCDVWCMCGGALAWRLDLKAALGLSLAAT